MKTEIRMTEKLYEDIKSDLLRQHPFAGERVGFAFGRLGTLPDGDQLILLTRFQSIPDDFYVRGSKIGTQIGTEALSLAMQTIHQASNANEGVFHVHIHEHRGETQPSTIDSAELPKMIPGFRAVSPNAPHGFIILSSDHGTGWAWLPNQKEPVRIDSVTVAGNPLGVFQRRTISTAGDRYSRQSFLGSNSEIDIAKCTVGVVGLGGGGSHIVQQLAHIGFQRYVIYDDDVVEESNLNRLVGGTTTDVLAETSKLHVAKTIIYGLQPRAKVKGLPFKWQQDPEALRQCHIVFGCVDSLKGRQELEVACRRYLIHYIDIGMDVHGTEKPVIGGQVIQSSPGGPCMWCMGFLTDENIGQEAAQYGNAGGRPQVVWSNGVLASIAVGLAVDIVTNWTQRRRSHAYLVYNGNRPTLEDSLTLRNLPTNGCRHFLAEDVGDPVLIEL